MNERKYTGSMTDWVTIAVTALPIGWINVYRGEDDDYLIEPCPALALEEATEYTRFWTDENGRHLQETLSCRRQTRTIFLGVEGGSAELVDVGAGNYLYTTTEAEHARRIA